MSEIRVRALLFASLRDAAGSREVEEALEAGSTVADLSAHLCTRYPALAPRLPLVRVAVNETMTGADCVLQNGDEIAYLPPVSGGAGPDPEVAVVSDPISVDAALAAVRRPDCGAVVLFLGTVRDNFHGQRVVGMEYEAHAVLAEHAMGEIVAEARRRWPVGGIRVVHRVGPMAVGDVSVAVAVSAPHRPAAFEAGRFAIDRLKEVVPIWKREFLDEGSVWIEGDDRIPAADHSRKA